jgi:hypothetical protein
MRSRVSCRSFQCWNLNQSDRSAVLESARVHASSGRLPGSQGIRYEYVDGPLTVWPVVGAREFLVAIGYRSRYWPWSVRFLSELFFADPEMTRPRDLKVPSLAEFDRFFEALRCAPSSFNGQTTRCVLRTATCDGTIVQTGLCLGFYAARESRFCAPAALGIWCAIAERGWVELGIRGVFAVLDTDHRLGDGTAGAGVYGVSWIVEPAWGM